MLVSGLLCGQTAWAADVDLTLQEAIEKALATKPTGQMALADQKKAEGALRQALSSAPAEILPILHSIPVVAASQRLQEMARREGFIKVALAEGPLPAQLVAAAARRFR